MRLAGQRLAIFRGWQRLEQAHCHRQGAAMPQHAFEVGDSALATVPPDHIGMLAIIDCSGSHGNAGRRRSHCLQQGRAKAQQLSSAAGGAFGEDRQWLAMTQGFDDPAHLAMNFATCRSLYIESSVLVGDPTDQGRVLDLGFCNERSAGPTAKDHDVEPTDMVGDHEAVGCKRDPFDLGADACDQCAPAKETPRPARLSKQIFGQKMWRDTKDQQDDEAGQSQAEKDG